MKVNNEIIQAVDNHQKICEKIKHIEGLLTYWANSKRPSGIKLIEYHNVEIRIDFWLIETMVGGVLDSLQIKREELIAELNAIEIVVTAPSEASNAS